jgi:superfamily I DNA/RNA helicase
MANLLTLAVAGARKTQGVVDHCASLPTNRRVLVLTFTQANQAELRKRLSKQAGDRLGVEVLGWFTFLLRHFVRPFLPYKFPGKRVLGFNFDGRPHMLATSISRFVDAKGAVYACELGRLAYELIGESGGHLMRRLECIYDEILIDEVQDLSSHDWEIVDVLMASQIDIHMVGDIRQSVLATNPRSSKNKKYAYAEVIKWFRERESRGSLTISESATTWRCRPEIAAFSDTIFDSAWSFPTTNSKNSEVTGHDGVYLLHSAHLTEYVQAFNPRCLRNSATSGKRFALDFINFKLAKGLTYERVLIVPTDGISKFLQKGILLEPGPAASFYVAVTRAAQSVAILLDKPGNSLLPYWRPSDKKG